MGTESVKLEGNLFNVEENEDLNTSNESYMSSSDDEDGNKKVYRLTFSADLTREEKALLSRRFEPYFTRRKIDAWDYFRQRTKEYNRKEWIKLCFDGLIKRCNQVPKNLGDLIELGKNRFGVFKHILATG